MESSKWYPLPSFSGRPALLASARFTASSYTLHVTDLANIWVEKLDRRGILLRSLQENTTIDLVDADVQQWDVFMSKLQAALDPASPDHHLTSLTLAAHPSSHGDLILRITCQLPKPLGALIWPVHLAKCQPVSLASELTLPLIKERYVRYHEAEDLMTQLKEKDAVISKLLDKLSTMHTPLELIFNSLSAKHTTTRAAAEEKIKGLAPFDESKWRSQRSIEPPKDATALLQDVFGGDLGFSCEADMDLGVSDTLNDWWTKLGHGLSVATTSGGTSGGRARYQVPKTSFREHTATLGREDDEDFEVQATPLLSSLSSQTVQANEDDTASEADDDSEPIPPRRVIKPQAKLGTIGKSFKGLSQPTQAPVTEPARKADDETASGSDSGSDNPPRPPSASPASVERTTPRKGIIGQIGGKGKAANATESPTKFRPGTAGDNSTSPKKTSVPKIGVIGKRTRAEAKGIPNDADAQSDESETEEMKAERKRAELAEELSRQSRVPARKKRKF
ncbi:XLF-domain-containing protein [Xylaria sp. CBS 124048]|nr:XLF-domain-containing protein [Xylaria sp. CBS 124048]